jgi:hypothetical protein
MKINWNYTFTVLVCMLTSVLGLSGQVLAKDCPKGNINEEVMCLREQNKQLKDKAKEYLKKCEATDSQAKKTVAQLLKEIEAKDKQIEIQEELIAQKQTSFDLQKQQSEHYEICCKNSPSGRLRFHVGIGATGTDNDVAGMLGVGYKRFNVFAFLQDQNMGVLLGYQF